MNNLETQKILSKIKKCFALSKSANANEAAVALKQAYALARKYNLEHRLEEVCEISSGRQLPAGYQINLPLYLAKLLNLINFVFQTRSVTRAQRISESQVKTTVEFHGYESDILIAEYAWEVLSKILTRARTIFLNTHRDGRMNKVTKTRHADIYSLGWIHSVEEEVKNLGRELSVGERTAHDDKIKAYQGVLYNNALVMSKVKANPIAAAAGISNKEYAAYQKGIADGKDVTLGKGVNASVKKCKALT